MKYKRRITSGALALTLFVGGSSAYAASLNGAAPAGAALGSASGMTHFQGMKGMHKGRHGALGAPGLGLNHNRVIGEVIAMTSTGFTLEAHGPRMRGASSTPAAVPPVKIAFDVRTSADTVFQKDGATTTAADLAIGQKAIVIGTIDPAAQIVTATKVNIITKLPDRPAKGLHKGPKHK